jgi:prophage DNA circulation protein
MRTLQRASYRGAPFWVESDQISGGRRLVVHEFPHRDVPYVEDMGRAAVRIQVTAYLASDTADSEAASLRKACDAGGPSRLELPLETLDAHCETFQRDFERDRLGFIAFSLVFVREGAAAAPYPAAYYARLAVVGVAALASPLAARFRRRFRGRRVAGYVRDSAVADIRAMAAALDVARGSVEIDAADGPGIARRIADLYADAEVYADVGAVADVYEDTRFDARQSYDSAPDLAAEVTEIVDAIRESAGPAAADALADLASYGAFAAARTAAATPSRRQQAENADAVAEVVRVPAAAAAVAAIVESEIADRRAAIAARARIVTIVDSELIRLGSGSHDLYVALAKVRDDALAAIERSIADLAPVLVVSAPRRMPALWWSQRIYGHHGRAGELAARTRVKHPGFMPSEFEVLAR